MAKPYKPYRHRQSGIVFRFAYDEADPSLLHIYARHLTTPDDAVRTFFLGKTTWDENLRRFETRTDTHLLTWFWVRPRRIVQVLSCMEDFAP